jgi:hypothetical protein
MGFLKKAARGEGIVAYSDEDFGGEGGVTQLEGQYMKMFMKIGRDFIHKDDFYRVIEEILDHLDIDDFELSLDLSDSSAQQRAEEYKHFLDIGQSGSDHYPDLIDLNKE